MLFCPVSPCRKLHSGMKTYGCELCGKRFLDSLRLRMHLLSHSGIITNADACFVCFFLGWVKFEI